MKYVPPSVHETAFNCPHCGALAKQFWYSVHADSLKKDNKPLIVAEDELEKFTFDKIDDNIEKKRLKLWIERMSKGLVFFEYNAEYRDVNVHNMWFSRCFNCEDVALWHYDRLLYPSAGIAPPVNADTPDDIKRDYEEASGILNASPRGAAALIRLAIQKICKELGQPGKNINDDIGALVAGGLDQRVQQALDLVRVVGNEAVHPGVMDLRDDRSTAETLFKLFNLIVDKTISEPKHVAEMFGSLPPEKLKQIGKRDGQKALAAPVKPTEETGS